MTIRIRTATRDEVPVLRSLIEASVRELQAADYTEKQREGALRTVFGVDSRLIEDRTYLVADASDASDTLGAAAPRTAADSLKPAIAGCGGWSKRKTLFGGDQWSGREDSLLDPARDAAKIRAFFVHPAWARQGVGTLILNACESAARAAGFSRFEMGATLTGVKLFSVKGYVPLKRMDVPLDDGEVLPIVQMEKRDPIDENN
ncbi:MAG TPA: GNAT family N-acetyltransferase [Candidatus Acidoferrum sp.]|nr:GNAT family N-acetyltransferase [Candidatus Acidoferrum sp.]